MDCRKLKTAAESITMPEEMKVRIVKNCKNTMEEHPVKTNQNRFFVKKPMALFAALALCLSMAVTVVAASGTLKGRFRDVKNWHGAVVGTSYERATDEIDMRVRVDGNDLTILVTFADPQMIPYRYVEELGIAAYTIVDTNGKTIKKGTAESAEIVNGQAAIKIRLDDIAGGNYKLVVTAFVAGKKAEQPLNINGAWECSFNK